MEQALPYIFFCCACISCLALLNALSLNRPREGLAWLVLTLIFCWIAL